MRYLLLTLICTVQACTTTSLGIGAYQPHGSTRDVFPGDGGIAKFQIRNERALTKSITGYCELMHVSNYGSGWPFNDRDEAWVDAHGCGINIKLINWR
jgi:hypothetical protein